MILKRLCPALIFLALPLMAQAQPPGWNDPFPPHQVMDNLYYVGTAELSSFLFTTDEGHILISSNYESSVPVIRDAVESLGFDFEDIRILISGHAHPDHVEGDALVKQLTGAEVVVGRLEIPALQAMSDGQHPIDRIVDEGDTVSLGDTTLVAHVLPGHTKGCLAWSTTLEEDGEQYYTLIECSLNGQYLQYVDNEDYPEIIEDMRSTYARAREFPAQLWVSSHGVFYGLQEKYEQLQRRQPGDPNPFVDPEGYQAHVDEFEQTFRVSLIRQLQEAGHPLPEWLQ